MKKITLSAITIITSIVSLQAQLYTPNAATQATSNGNNNIGIGTINPTAKLTIQAWPYGHPTPLKAISILGPNSPTNSNSAQEISWDFAAAGSAVIRSYRGSNWDTYLEFLTNANLGGNNPQIRMHITDEGNIGIGTTVPKTKLDVVGIIKSYEPTPLSTTTNSSQLINEIGGNTIGNVIMNKKWLIRDATSDNWRTARLHDGISVDATFITPHVDTKTWWERDPNDNIQSWGNAGETYLTINNSNVGIGTTNPTAKLTVAGDINSREVRVTVNAGADFVFENDYNLPSLASVETFIKENKHLPEIASAKEMQENGINLSEMNIKLLQKIEELTLYTIEQNKNNLDLKQKIEKLEKENEGFKSLSERLSKIENQLK